MKPAKKRAAPFPLMKLQREKNGNAKNAGGDYGLLGPIAANIRG
jgi:hypothetical protein